VQGDDFCKFAEVVMLGIYLNHLRCHEETDEVGADEPYVLVAAVDLRSATPAFDVIRYGPFGDVDAREDHFAPGLSHSFWGLNEKPADLRDPQDAIFVVALMENDNGNPEALRTTVLGVVTSSIAGSAGATRDERLVRLIRDVNGILLLPTAFGLNQDEQVGPPQELRFTREELAAAEGGNKISRTLNFRGDGGNYTLTFEILRSQHVFGAIRDKWVGLNAERGHMGLPLEVENPTFDGIGRKQQFQGGIISWHPNTGAHGIWGLIGQRWLEIGREQFGYPITDELGTTDGNGRHNHFRAVHLAGAPEASIFWSPESGAHEVFGAIRHKWAEMGWETSHLGFPVFHEQDHPVGRIQRFQGGSLLWARDTGIVTVI
jgi:hypothetical protein